MTKSEGTASLNAERYSTLGSVTLTFDLWVKCCEWWRKIIWLRIFWWPLRVNRTVNEEMRGYRPSKMTFLTVFGSVTLTFEIWVKMLRMVTQDIVIAHRLVAFASISDSKWRNERIPTVKNDVFSRFWLRDLDLWPLCQMLRMVTQDIVIAQCLVIFASKLDSKWRNQRVPRHSTLNAIRC